MSCCFNNKESIKSWEGMKDAAQHHTCRERGCYFLQINDQKKKTYQKSKGCLTVFWGNSWCITLYNWCTSSGRHKRGNSVSRRCLLLHMVKSGTVGKVYFSWLIWCAAWPCSSKDGWVTGMFVKPTFADFLPKWANCFEVLLILMWYSESTLVHIFN